MTALNIVRRDLLRLARSPGRTALLFAVPITLAAIFALVFGSAGGSPEITIRVLLYDEDDSLLSNALQGAAGRGGQGAKLDIEAVGQEGYERIEKGEASALLHIPKGFTEALLRGNPTTLRLIKNPSQRFLPQAVEVGVDLGAAVLSQGSRILRPELLQLDSLLADEDAPSDAVISALSVAINQRLRSLGTYVLPPVIDFETLTVVDDEKQPDVSILAFFVPGLAVLGLLFLAQSATRDLHRDRRSGLLRHLLTAPVSSFDYLLGKSLSVLLITSLGFGALVILGALAGLRWGPPLAVVAMVLASSLAISGALLFFTSLARNERVSDNLTSIVVIVWAMVGGSFVPISQLPPFLLPVAQSSPVYWATEGFNTLILHQGGFGDILPNLLILIAVGTAGLLGGSHLLRKRMLKGEP